MKLFLALLLSFCSVTAFAGYTKFYFGSGYQISSEGERSEFLISFTKKKVGMNKYLHSYDVQFIDKNVHLDFYLTKDYASKNFFNVHMREGDEYMKVGHGYCWAIRAHNASKCYSTATMQNYADLGTLILEQTAVFKHDKGMMYVMGSKRDAEGKPMAIWKEELKLLK